MVTFLILVFGALPEPRYNEDGLVLMQSEATLLYEHRVAFEQRQLQRIRAIGERVADVRAEIADLEAKRDASGDQGERDAIDAQIAAIEAGVIERGKLAIQRIQAARPPTATQARQHTIRRVYDPATDSIIRQDADENGELSQAESGWPNFVFDLVDGDGNGSLTAGELGTYWATL